MTHENDGARPRWISWSITGVTLLILATSALLPRFAGATRHVAQPALDSAQPAPQAEPDVSVRSSNIADRRTRRRSEGSARRGRQGVFVCRP